MAGVVGPLPYDLHPWSPVVYVDTASPLTLPLSASGAAVGVASRKGSAAALTLPLAAPDGGFGSSPLGSSPFAAGGTVATATRGGPGAACTLPLTAPTATGHAITAYFAGPGTAILLPFTQVSGLGVKAVSLQGVMQVLPLVDMPGSGLSCKQGNSQSITLGLTFSDLVAVKAGVGTSAPAELRISAGQGDGRRYEWTFYTPTDYDRQPFSPIAPNVLTYTVPYSSTVWQDANGEWHTVRGPNPALLSGALRIYEGGRLHTLSPDDIANLTAAGFGDNLVLQEMH